MNKIQDVSNTNLAQVVKEYDIELAKRSEGISQRNIAGVMNGIISAGCGYMGYVAGDLLPMLTYKDWPRIVAYGVCGSVAVWFLAKMSKEFVMSAILKSSYRELANYRNQIKNSMVKTNEK